MYPVAEIIALDFGAVHFKFHSFGDEVDTACLRVIADWTLEGFDISGTLLKTKCPSDRKKKRKRSFRHCTIAKDFKDDDRKFGHMLHLTGTNMT